MNKMNPLLDTPFIRQCRELHAWRIQWQKDNPLLLLKIRMEKLEMSMRALSVPISDAGRAMLEYILTFDEATVDIPNSFPREWLVYKLSKRFKNWLNKR